MPKIVPHLWFDKEAKEAASFYTSLFQNSKITSTKILENTPSGDAEIVNFELEGQSFASISAGPYFKFNPSVSLMVNCNNEKEITEKWNALIEGGTALMPLDEYPFSKLYGWLEDRFGLSWQFIFTDEIKQKIVPNLLFSNTACGMAEEAIDYYTKIFNPSEKIFISKYGENESSTPNAKINYASFSLLNSYFTAMDNGYDVEYNFNESFSFIINCKDQNEIDYYWDNLSHYPESEQCGWLKDKFGVSWQVVPDNMDSMLLNASKEETIRVTETFLKMKKFDLKTLENARFGK